jgi:hypothetical protein
MIDLFSHNYESAHYNTTLLKGVELKRCIAKAEDQNDDILRYFKANPNILFSACDIYKAMGERYLLTSVRRAITTLYNNVLLEKTNQQKIGMYGKPVFLYTLKMDSWKK